MNVDLVTKPYQYGNEKDICELFYNVYKSHLTSENWNWRFRNSPSGQGKISLSWHDSVLSAHYAVTSVNFSIEGKNCKTGLSGTTMTHPDYRGLGLFPILAEDVYSLMKSDGFAMVWGFPNNMSHRTFVKNLGWEDIYEIPFFRLKLDVVKDIPKRNNDIMFIERFDDRFDNLWDVARNNYSIIGYRDKKQLNWRYVDKPDSNYSIVSYVHAGNLIGYLVFKQYNEELQIVDILTANTDANDGLTLVLEVVRLAIEMKLKSVSMWLNLNTPLHRELEKYGFINDAPVTYFGARLLTESIQESHVFNMRNWYITMGDSDVF